MRTINRPLLRLGFDGGGTKTRAVVVDDALQIVGSGESGSGNPYAVGMDAALDHIERAAADALASANLSRAEIGGWGLGLGGVCSASESADVEAALRARIGPEPKIIAVEDVVATWAGAFGGAVDNAPRAVCIAGTGVGCWGKNARGNIAQADGAGPLLGDRGSGYWIGESALRHAARALDGVAPADDLSRAVLEHFGVGDIKALIRVVYAPDFARSNVGALARVVLAHQSVASARAILVAAGRELAATSLAVLGRLNEGQDGQNGASGEIGAEVTADANDTIRGEIALIGGVLAHAAPVKSAFVERLQAVSPRLEFVEARHEPAIGAALLV